MNDKTFWQILDDSRKAAIAELPDAPNEDEVFDDYVAALKEELSKVEFGDLVTFDSIFQQKMIAAYRWDLWGAVYWLFGGCCDDSFSDFRSNLIGLGKTDYEKVLESPDNLAEIMTRPNLPYMLSEGFQNVAMEVYEVLGGPLFQPNYPRYPERPTGEEFDFDDATVIARRYPRIVERFPESGPFF
ncbi:DUF4240 domain-containing protein [bacterium]|nr:DUF4240 domain-containing protein [bacterium]